jgi:hypothetical protein
LNKREDAKLEDFAKQRDDLMEQMLSTRRNAVFTDYLSSVRQKLDAAGSIVIYKDVLAKIDGPGKGLPGGMPGEDDSDTN